jgi:hypothetical protein
VLVTHDPEQEVDYAVGDGYLMVDLGLTHGLERRRLFPDAPEPMIRVSQAKMALEHVLEVGGAAYLPVRRLTAHLEAGRLHLVRNAPTISRRA